MKKYKHRLLGAVMLIILLLGLMIGSYFIPGIKNFSSPEYVRSFLLNLGGAGYLAYVVLIIASVPLPIPSTPIVIAGGYVFGTVMGSLLSLIASVIGAVISFLLIRSFGAPLLEKMIDKHHLIHFNHLFKKRGISVALVSYIVPVFPADTIGLLLGLTNIKLSTFLLITIFGHIPRNFILNVIGNDLYSGFTWKSIILLVIIVLFSIMAIFREKLKRLVFKEIRELETEAGKIEQEIEVEIKKAEGKTGLQKKTKPLNRKRKQSKLSKRKFYK